MKLAEIIRRPEFEAKFPSKKKLKIKRIWKKQTGNGEILYLGTDAVTSCSTCGY